MDKSERMKVRAIEGAEGSIIEKPGTGERLKPGEAVPIEEILAFLQQEDEAEEASDDSTPDTDAPPPDAERQE